MAKTETDSAIRQLLRDPEKRVRWLLDFAKRDNPDAALSWRKLQSIQVGTISPSREVTEREQRLVRETRDQLRAVFAELAHRRPLNLDVPATYWIFRAPPPRPKGARVSGQITRTSDQRLASARMPSDIALLAIDSLDEPVVGADRLRVCPLIDHGEPCGEIFLAHRKPEYGTKKHADRAAWLRYLESAGGSRAAADERARARSTRRRTTVPETSPAPPGKKPKRARR